MLLAFVAILAGCVSRTGVPAYLVNESGDALKVSLTMERRSVPTSAGQRSICGFDPGYSPILVGKAEEATDSLFRGWRPVELSNYDEASCKAGMTLPPGGALLLFWNGTCSDYASNRSASKPQPTLHRLAISGEGRSLELGDFDAARAFKASRWNRDCKFVVR